MARPRRHLMDISGEFVKVPLVMVKSYMNLPNAEYRLINALHACVWTTPRRVTLYLTAEKRPIYTLAAYQTFFSPSEASILFKMNKSSVIKALRMLESRNLVRVEHKSFYAEGETTFSYNSDSLVQLVTLTLNPLTVEQELRVETDERDPEIENHNPRLEDQNQPPISRNSSVKPQNTSANHQNDSQDIARYHITAPAEFSEVLEYSYVSETATERKNTLIATDNCDSSRFSERAGETPCTPQIGEELKILPRAEEQSWFKKDPYYETYRNARTLNPVLTLEECDQAIQLYLETIPPDYLKDEKERMRICRKSYEAHQKHQNNSYSTR